MSSGAGASYGEIANLYSKYANAINASNAEAFADCFTEDASFWPNRGPFVPDKGDFAGRKAIEGFIAKTSEQRPPHLIFNLEVSAMDERQAACAAVFALFDLQAGAIGGLGRYDDTVTLGEDGQWRFSEKQVYFLWQSDAYAQRAREGIPSSDE